MPVDLNTEHVCNLPEHGTGLREKGFSCRVDQGRAGWFCSQTSLILFGVFCASSELKLATSLKQQFMWTLVRNC